MADQAMDYPEHLPGAVPTPGNPTADQASDEARGGAAAEAATGDGGVLEKSKSGIWNHFDKMPDCHGRKMVKCRYCSKEYVCSNAGTGNMWRHIRKAHPTHVSGQQKAGSMDGLDTESQDPVYSDEALREVLVEWIATRNLPFNEVEAPAFRKLIRLLNPGAKLPCADTLKRDLDRRADKEKERMRAMLENVPGRLSYGVDGWTSPSGDSYVGITAHCIIAGVATAHPAPGHHTPYRPALGREYLRRLQGDLPRLRSAAQAAGHHH